MGLCYPPEVERLPSQATATVASATRLHGRREPAGSMLLLRKELLDRLATRRAPMPEWQHLIDDLADLSAVEVNQDGRRALLRTAPGPSIDPICRALGLTLPPIFQEMPPGETPQNPG